MTDNQLIEFTKGWMISFNQIKEVHDMLPEIDQNEKVLANICKAAGLFGISIWDITHQLVNLKPLK